MSTPGVLTVRDGASASAGVPGRQGQSLRQDRVVLRRIEVGMLDDPGPLLKVDPISSR